MKFLLTGGTGFLGSVLSRKLSNYGHQITILSRKTALPLALQGHDIRLINDIFSLRKTDQFDVVINLAGEGIADRPWSATRKQLLRTSRLATTEELLRAMQRLKSPPPLLLSGSATGIYGSTTAGAVDENTALALHPDDFAQQLCMEWENAARQANGMKVLLLRSGVVLGSGGLLARLLPLFRLGLGGRLGDGQQLMSWVHIDDWVAMVLFLIQHDCAAGPYNLTSPAPVSNAEFTRLLATQLHRLALLSLPGSLLQLALGDMSQLLLGSQHVLPGQLMKAGYNFRYPEAGLALNQILMR